MSVVPRTLYRRHFDQHPVRPHKTMAERAEILLAPLHNSSYHPLLHVSHIKLSVLVSFIWACMLRSTCRESAKSLESNVDSLQEDDSKGNDILLEGLLQDPCSWGVLSVQRSRDFPSHDSILVLEKPAMTILVVRSPCLPHEFEDLSPLQFSVLFSYVLQLFSNGIAFISFVIMCPTTSTNPQFRSFIYPSKGTRIMQHQWSVDYLASRKSASMSG